MITEKLLEILKKDGIVAIATLGQDGPHMVNSWTSYVRISADGRLLSDFLPPTPKVEALPAQAPAPAAIESVPVTEVSAWPGWPGTTGARNLTRSVPPGGSDS